jgi:hypothetical protein
MTIAACYVSNEGVVFGADSTSTYASGTGKRHYNNEQKIFEIGEMGSTLGVVTWGLGGLPDSSYRLILAELSDRLIAQEPASVQDAAQRWSDLLWGAYSIQLQAQRTRYTTLSVNPAKTPNEQQEMADLNQTFSVGFCIGGHVKAERRSRAFVVQFNLGLSGAPAPEEIQRGAPIFGGVPSLILRMINGIDQAVYESILNSSDWKGGKAGLDSLIRPHVLGPQILLPLREAIDWIYSSIFTTIKAIKFSSLPPVCGGPIEVAVITSDRRFRWVRHKGLDQALGDHSARGTF